MAELKHIEKRPALARAGVYIVIDDQTGKYCGKLLIAYPNDGAGRLYASLWDWAAKETRDIQNGSATGYGYDKVSAAIDGMVFGDTLADREFRLDCGARGGLYRSRTIQGARLHAAMGGVIMATIGTSTVTIAEVDAETIKRIRDQHGFKSIAEAVSMLVDEHEGKLKRANPQKLSDLPPLNRIKVKDYITRVIETNAFDREKGQWIPEDRIPKTKQTLVRHMREMLAEIVSANWDERAI